MPHRTPRTQAEKIGTDRSRFADAAEGYNLQDGIPSAAGAPAHDTREILANPKIPPAPALPVKNLRRP